MKNNRLFLAGLLLCLPAASFAQADLAAATYFGVELGTGKSLLHFQQPSDMRQRELWVSLGKPGVGV